MRDDGFGFDEPGAKRGLSAGKITWNVEGTVEHTERNADRRQQQRDLL